MLYSCVAAVALFQGADIKPLDHNTELFRKEVVAAVPRRSHSWLSVYKGGQPIPNPRFRFQQDEIGTKKWIKEILRPACRPANPEQYWFSLVTRRTDLLAMSYSTPVADVQLFDNYGSTTIIIRPRMGETLPPKASRSERIDFVKKVLEDACELPKDCWQRLSTPEKSLQDMYDGTLLDGEFHLTADAAQVTPRAWWEYMFFRTDGQAVWLMVFPLPNEDAGHHKQPLLPPAPAPPSRFIR